MNINAKSDKKFEDSEEAKLEERKEQEANGNVLVEKYPKDLIDSSDDNVADVQTPFDLQDTNGAMISETGAEIQAATSDGLNSTLMQSVVTKEKRMSSTNTMKNIIIQHEFEPISSDGIY